MRLRRTSIGGAMGRGGVPGTAQAGGRVDRNPCAEARTRVVVPERRRPVQEPETCVLCRPVSNRDAVVSTRVIRFEERTRLFHVYDYDEDGRLRMAACHTAFEVTVPAAMASVNTTKSEPRGSAWLAR